MCIVCSQILSQSHLKKWLEYVYLYTSVVSTAIHVQLTSKCCHLLFLYSCSIEERMAVSYSKSSPLLSVVKLSMTFALCPSVSSFFDCFPDLNTIPHPTVQWKYNGALLDVSNTAKYLANLRTARLFISVVTTSDAVSSVHVSGVTQQQFVVAYVVAVLAQGMHWSSGC